MARKARNHHDEQIRRNQLSFLRGFKSRADERHQIETGKVAPQQPQRVRSPKTRAAQETRLTHIVRITKRQRAEAEAKADAKARAKPSPAVKDFGDRYPDITPTQRAQDWSNLFARAEAGKYNPGAAKSLGVTKRAYTTAYLNAFVKGDTRYDAVRHNKKGASPYLYYWFVSLNHYMTADEYEASYGPAQ